MLPIYATALAVGGTLLLASLVLGHHGIDHGEGVSADHSLDGHVDGDGTGGGMGLFAGFLSLRFWTFAAAFFGLTGVVFETFKLADGRVVLGLAIVLGVVSGLVAGHIVRRLRSQVVNSMPTEIGYVGLVGEVLLDVSPEEPGQIRVSSRGSLVDLPARAQGSARIAKGGRALVVDVANGTACVAPAPASNQQQGKERNS